MIIKAKLIKSLPTETINSQGKTYKKYSIEVLTEEKFPQPVQIIAWGEQGLEKLKKLEKDGVFEFHVNIKGRKWKKDEKTIKFFHEFDLWKAERVITEQKAAMNASAPLNVSDLEDDDDLPF